MAVEDFFTLTEMKDGLSGVARVKELMSILQKQKHKSVLSIHDEARDWSTVASILTATDNVNCLDQFIHLNGLWFLNRWLMHSSDAVGGPMEETINSILRALQNLPLKRKRHLKKFISSGIGRTIKQILVIGNPTIQNGAKALLYTWDFMSHESLDCQDEHVPSTCPDSNDSFDEEGDGQGNSATDSVDNTCVHFNDDISSTKLMLTDVTEDVDVLKPNQCNMLKASSSGKNLKKILSAVESPGSHTEIGSASISESPSSVKRTIDDQPEMVKKDSTIKDIQAEVNKDASQSQNNWKETCVVSPKSESVSLNAEQKILNESHNFTSKDAKSAPNKFCEPQANNLEVDCKLTDCNVTSKEIVDVLGIDQTGGNTEPKECSITRLEVPGICTNLKRTRNSHISSVKRVKHNPSNSIHRTDSNIGIDQSTPESCLVFEEDALDVSVQVSIETNREVVDRGSNSLFVGKRKEEVDFNHSESEESESIEPNPPAKHDQSNNFSSPSENSTKSSENTNVDSKSPRTLEELHSSSIKNSQHHLEKKIFFDLNDVCPEVDDSIEIPVCHQHNNLSAPVAIIATSKGVPVFPAVTTVLFDGELGWKGSAATSAFRPASPRRTPDGEKTVSGPNQKPILFEFDLNMVDGVENDDDEAPNLNMAKQMPNFSGLPSGESSVEVTSAKAEKLKLDLNCSSDENIFPKSPSCWRLFHQNRNGSSSPASSSNKPPYVRDIDLNDNPSSLLDSRGSSNLNRYYSTDMGVHGRFKPDDQVTIMGSRIAVEGKESAGQAQVPLSMESSPMAMRSMLAYHPYHPQAQAGMYGYNGLVMGQPYSHPSAMYGGSVSSFPYMADSRGATVVPQILGSSSALNGQNPRALFQNVQGVQSAAGGGSRSTICLDLNATTLSLDGSGIGSREFGSYKQLYKQGVHGSAITEEQMRSASQVAAISSSVGQKRKEMERRWEVCPNGYKQVTPWQ